MTDKGGDGSNRWTINCSLAFAPERKMTPRLFKIKRLDILTEAKQVLNYFWFSISCCALNGVHTSFRLMNIHNLEGGKKSCVNLIFHCCLPLAAFLAFCAWVHSRALLRWVYFDHFLEAFPPPSKILLKADGFSENKLEHLQGDVKQGLVEVIWEVHHLSSQQVV